ncbi:MAG: hypothetical protein H6733_07895 [Alphaproteobacteria bacterium]|nr:hypothetical protein [Alphaproteobacteria bacterium]
MADSYIPLTDSYFPDATGGGDGQLDDPVLLVDGADVVDVGSDWQLDFGHISGDTDSTIYLSWDSSLTPPDDTFVRGVIAVYSGPSGAFEFLGSGLTDGTVLQLAILADSNPVGPTAGVAYKLTALAADSGVEKTATFDFYARGYADEGTPVLAGDLGQLMFTKIWP